jgi:predicted acetyltransferase
MGDPNTLRDFVEWTTTEFPADNYALILWNHGDGWKSINNWVPWADDDLKDTKDAGSSRGICVDNTNSDYLTLQETEDALTGKYVQLLGYDACLMHMVEVVYQVMTNAGVSVGSEEVEPGDGWPYDTILADLTVTPTMTENALGTVIVDRYMGSYGYTGSETQSAVDNLELPNLVTAVDNLAQALMTEINGGHVADVQQARSETEEIYYNYYIDLYHFAEKIQLYVPGAAAQAQAVMNSVGVAVYEEAHGTSVPNDHGLSIYYPRVEDGAWSVSTNGDNIPEYSFWFGFAGDLPVVGDINQDGLDDIAYVHNGAWSVSTNGDNIPEYSFWFGFPGETPVVGDINQDGLDDIAYVHNGAWSVSTNGDNIPEYSFWFGFPGDIPVVGDINQDGLDDIAYFHDGAWCVSTNADNIPEYCFWFGFPGDIPVVGDINQDELDDIAYFHDGAWCVSTNADNIPEYYFWFGFAGDIPVVGNIG